MTPTPEEELATILEEMGEAYFPEHEYPASFWPQNAKTVNEAKKAILALFRITILSSKPNKLKHFKSFTNKGNMRQELIDEREYGYQAGIDAAFTAIMEALGVHSET